MISSVTKFMKVILIMTPKISVVLAAYHGEKYIGEQLESIFRQTRLPDEILIGDDSRNDATHQVVESLRDQYPGTLRYIRNPERLGFVKNFVHLAQEAEGDIIFFSDQDDVWHPEKIEILSGILENDPASRVAVCNSEMVDAELNPLHETLLDGISDFQTKMKRINEGKGFFPLLNQSIGFSGHNMAMKRSYLPVFTRIPESYRAHDLWLEHSAGLLGVLRYVDRPLTKYRMHAQNTSTPCVQKIKKNLLHRFHEIWKTSDDVFYIADLLRDFVRFTESYPENPNRKLLIQYSRYFSWRAELLKKPRWKRLFMLVSALPRLGDHYRYGFGTRSMVRDFIVKADAPREKEQQAK